MDGLESARFFNQAGEGEQHTNTDATLDLRVKTFLSLFCPPRGCWWWSCGRRARGRVGVISACITFAIDYCTPNHMAILELIQTS